MALEGLLFLAAVLWPCAGIIHGGQMSCSLDWLMVTVSPCHQSKNLYLFADEFYLGLGCPVTRIQTYAYDFIYPVSECGIRKKIVSEDTVLFQTELYYIPRNMLSESQKIPLECSTSRLMVMYDISFMTVIMLSAAYLPWKKWKTRPIRVKSVWLKPVSTANEIKLDPSPFMADLKPTPEELGLLNSENVFLP